MKPKSQNRKLSFSSSDGGFSDNSQKDKKKQMKNKQNKEQNEDNEEILQQQQQLQQNELTDIKFFNENLPPSQPIVVKDYSLEADMIFGWQPKIQFQGPVPMKFDSSYVDIIISHLYNNQKENKTNYKLIYLGFRPSNTLKMHSSYCDNTRDDCYYFKFSSLYGNSRMNGFFHALENKNKNKFILPFLGMNPNINKLQNKMSPSIQTNNNNNTFEEQKQLISIVDNTSSFMITEQFPLNKLQQNEEQNNKQQDFKEIEQEQDQCNLIFDSYFESGNLDCVVKIGENEYDLFMRVDSNTKGHLQWYYFKVKGAKPMQKIKFNICNFTKSKSLYLRGMKPYVYSSKENQFFKTTWQQQGEKIQYQMKEFRYPFIKEYIDEDTKQKVYYQLSFEYTFKYDDDVVSFAYCPPYTFSMLSSFIKELSLLHKLKSFNFLKEDKLSSSMSGLEVPLLTITDFNSPNEEIEKRKVIVITSRIHPGESNSSYVMHGFLQHLFTDEAAEIRKKCIFKIIPMMNPDGVVLGNYRTGIAGRDLNRVFANPDKMLFPTVIGLKELIQQLKTQYGQNVIMFLDLHGHSVKKNVFTYGPDYPIFDLNYYKCRLFSKILAKTTDMFRYYSCIFRISQMKKNTARGIFFKDFDIGNCFTIESSNGSYYIGNQTTIDFSTDLWINMGIQIVNGIKEYVQTILDYEISQQIKNEQKLFDKEIKQEEQSSSTQATTTATAGSRSDNSGFITQRGNIIQKNSILPSVGFNVTEDISQGNNIKIKNEKINYSQKYQSDNEQQDNNLYASKGNLKFEKKRKSQSKNKSLQKNNKYLQVKNMYFNKQFVLEESPFSKYFSKQAEEEAEQQKKKEGAESDEFSEGGSDSESEGEDYDKAFLKNFQAKVQRDFQLFDKYFKNIDNYEVKTEQTNQKRDRLDAIDEKDDYLNERITQNLNSQKYDVMNPLIYRIGGEQQNIGLRSSLYNQTVLTPQHLRTSFIRPKTNDRFIKNEFQIKEIHSQRNTPQKQHTVMNSMQWDIFKDRNQRKGQKSKNISQDNNNSNLLSNQMNFTQFNEQLKQAAVTSALNQQFDFDKYDDLYSQEFTLMEQAMQQQQQYSSRTGRKSSATPFKDDNLNIINFFHKLQNQPLVSTTNNQSLLKIIHKIKDIDKRDDDSSNLGKRVIVLTNQNIQCNNIKNSLIVNRPALDPLPFQSGQRQNKLINSSLQQESQALHLKNILKNNSNNINNNNLFYVKERFQKNSQQINQTGALSPHSPKRYNLNSMQQFQQQQISKQEEQLINKSALQNNFQDSYYITSNIGFGQKDDSSVIKKRDSSLQNNYNSNTNNNNMYNTQLISNNNNNMNNTKLIQSNQIYNQSYTPTKQQNNSAHSHINRRISQESHFTSNHQNINQIINASFAFQSPRDNSNKKINYPSAFYKIKKHFTSKKKADEQKSLTGYNPKGYKIQHSYL